MSKPILSFCPICGNPPLVDVMTDNKTSDPFRVKFYCKHFYASGKDYDEAIDGWNEVTKAYCDQEAMREFYANSREEHTS